MEPDPDFIEPNAYDVMLTDLNRTILLTKVSSDLNIKYLQAPDVPDDKPLASVLEGKIWGEHMRPLVNLVVSSTHFKKPINVIFLVDTGCPHLYLCEDALTALGFNDHIPEKFEIDFRSATFTANMSPLVMSDGRVGHFKEVNVLGASFLRYTHSVFHMDYNKLTFTVNMMHSKY